VLLLLWLHVPVVAVFIVLSGHGPLHHALVEWLPIVALAWCASAFRSRRRLSSLLATTGLLTCSGILVHLSGGLIELHFHFFVMVGVIVLYEDWVTFLAAIAYVVGHHGVLGTIAPEDVFNHPAALARPWLWASVHGLFVTAMSVVGVIAWRFSERSREAAGHQARQLAQAQALARLGSWEWDVATDELSWSDEHFRLLGLEPGSCEPSVERFIAAVHPEDRAAVADAVSTVTAGGSVELVFRVVRPGGEVRWVTARSEAVTGRPVRGTILDVTEQIVAERARLASDERYRRIVESGQDGVWTLDAHERTTFVNRRLASMLGWTPQEMLGTPLSAYMDRESLELARAGGARRRQGTYVYRDVRLRRRDGSHLWVLLSANPLPGDPASPPGTLAMVTDITERKEMEAELARLALRDPLTGLPNRTLLLDRLHQALHRARRHDTLLALLFLDVDRFKVVNDSLGHGAGDELLREVGRRLETAAGPDVTVARFGGDEFVVLVEDVGGPEAALDLAGRLWAATDVPVGAGGREVRVTVSVGIALAGAEPTTAEALLRDADAAMYEAKEKGRARAVLFDPAIRSRAVDRLDTQTALQAAIGTGQFRLHYQPEVDLGDGSVVGVEALLRWAHPERGLLTPPAFLPALEDLGLLLPVGRWLLGEACRQLQAWRARHPHLAGLVVWVNLPAAHVRDPGLVDLVAATLAETRLPAANLGIEITEDAFLRDGEATGERLGALRALGVRVAIDDFGTGFSSLGYLKRFPLDLLKIDGSFVAGLTRDEGDAAIVGSVVGLAHSFGLDCLAEGVETFDQLAALHRLGCDRAQGHLFGPAVPPAAVEELLADRPAAFRAATPAAAAARPGTVLVCDDERTVRWALRAAFEHAGAVVAEAIDAEDCLAVAATRHPDLIVLDLLLPGRDGLSLLADLRRLHPATPVVIVSAFATDGVRERAVELGAAACIDKLDFLTRVDEVVPAIFVA
jgi:diguanylate cyclase (GGDEF)-like protein/PAS domain S-box-containing protein